MIRFMISLQISMLHDELSRLTLTELDKREERQDVERVCNLGFHSSILSSQTTKIVLEWKQPRGFCLIPSIDTLFLL